ncbi:MAG: MFS transporter [Arachnia sp.]
MLTARYALLQSAYWSAFCLIVNFSSVYLLAHGLSNAQIGVLMAVASAVSTVLQPLVAGVVDRSRMPLRVWLTLGGVLLAALAAALVPQGEGILVALTYGLLIAAIQVIQPVVNSVGMAAIARGMRVNFGVARACGSVAFALISAGAGALVAATSDVAVPLLLIAVAAVFIAAAVTFVLRHPAGPSVADEAAGAGPAPAMSRRAWAMFALLLAGITLGMTSHNLLNAFLFQIVGFHGGDAAAMGVAMMIAALVELPTMAFFDRLVARWTPGTLLVVAGVVFAVKNLATYLAPNLALVYAAQVLQFAGFGLLIPATVYYVNRLLPAALRVRGQSYMTMTMSAGSVFGAMIGGLVLDAAGVPALLLVGTVAATAGAVLVWLGADRKRSAHFS